MRLGM